MKMHKMLKIMGLGFLMWFVPFIISVAIFPLKTSFTPLFESIMPVIITSTAVILALTYFKGLNNNYLTEGLIIGVSWGFISILIDLLLFLPPSPMQMSFTNYIMDIGITYLIIPSVTIGMGYTAQKLIK
jgi:hypothetical protein